MTTPQGDNTPGTCLHCGEPIPPSSTGGERFCCGGCRAAYEMIQGLGLDSYYQRRCLDPDQPVLRPDEMDARFDFEAYTQTEDDGPNTLHLMVEGLQCAACVWLIETVLRKHPGVLHARINMTTRRLVLKWDPEQTSADDLVSEVAKLGYRLAPYDPTLISAETQQREKALLRAMVVAGFAAGNVMLFSVSVWAGHSTGMGEFTRGLMHWLSALVALPAIAYSARPFFNSALTALKAGRTNMDVPISLAVLLASSMSLVETIRLSQHVYFDSAISLVFFLLIGRYLDSRARGRARSAGENLMGLRARAVTILLDDGGREVAPPEKLKPGMKFLTSTGERIAADGLVLAGESDIDTSLINGESIPVQAKPGEQVFAGTLNLSGALTIEVTQTGEDTLLGEIVRLMEAAEDARAKFVALADRVARLYAPVVHTLAASAFLGWWLLGGLVWQDSLMIAIAVLIITCPCALGLAVPAVQVVAGGRFLARGILMKSGTALERLASIDVAVFDKTGTLTQGAPHWINRAEIDEDDVQLAASLAVSSKHPLSRALCLDVAGIKAAEGVQEVPGFGLKLATPDGEVRLGRGSWCANAKDHEGAEAELWLSKPNAEPIRFAFIDQIRADAAEVIEHLKSQGIKVMLLSGDRAPAVQATAELAGIEDWHAGLKPGDKVDHLLQLAQDGKKAMMVGDGLNDAPALAAAHVSQSPSSAADVSQTAADVVFQGDKLAPVLESLKVAKLADKLIKQNFALSFLYNAFTIPLALAGYVTPLIAAVAMSTSSLVVIGNSLRLGWRTRKVTDADALHQPVPPVIETPEP
ncbi:heavy metal translocating P-type ATPase metal-binding domain-containing protein [Magnetovibrio sp. PR-2]|uniref:heavy metal translocating P-type ATPase metal-binding domain-containing protein n=1 Tax=Magnetovibrio sp. PR-2 TaxID=3120356 RepID=UPI002FCE4066